MANIDSAPSGRELPSPGRWALVGFLAKLARHGDVAFDDLFDKHGDVVTFTVPRLFELLPGVPRMVLLRDPELIRPLFTMADEFIDSTKANRVLEMLYGDRSLFLIDGPEHRRLRKLLLPRLRGDMLSQWAGFMESSTEREARTWIGDDPVQIHPRLLDVSLELILKVTLGVSDADLPRWKPPMHHLLETAASDQTTWRYTTRKLGSLKYWRSFHKVLDQCNALVLDEISRRRRNPDRDHDDLLDLLMNAEGEPLTDIELRDQVFTILIAGHETSATTAAWAVERLVRTPAALARAVEEARTTDEQTYVEAVVHETLRLRPPVALVGRVTRTTVELGPYAIPPNTSIMPIIRSIHRQESIYDNAETFEPQRFIDERPGVFSLIPFGGGPHRCVGDRLAIFQTKLILRTIFRTVDLTAVHAADENVARKAIAYVPGNGVLVHARMAAAAGLTPTS